MSSKSVFVAIVDDLANPQRFILVLNKAKESGKYRGLGLPGGGVDQADEDEAAERRAQGEQVSGVNIAVYREVQEETGLTEDQIKIADPMDREDYFHKVIKEKRQNREGEGLHTIYVLLATLKVEWASVKDLCPQKNQDDTEKAMWVSIKTEDLKKLMEDSPRLYFSHFKRIKGIKELLKRS